MIGAAWWQLWFFFGGGLALSWQSPHCPLNALSPSTALSCGPTAQRWCVHPLQLPGSIPFTDLWTASGSDRCLRNAINTE